MTDNVVLLANRQKPVSYTIDVTHHFDGTVEVFVRDVSDDDRSREAVMETIISWATKHMKAHHIHRAMLDRIDALMGAEKSEELEELSNLASACQAYEQEVFNTGDA
jgi:hypothetical protein